MNWQYVEIDEVYFLHEKIIKRARTKASVRDFALLHSVVERPKATYGGEELYPTVFSKAAALLQSLTLNHPFSDGNKRTAWGTVRWFLVLNGFLLKVEKEAAVEFMLWIDNEKPDFKEIVIWLKKNSKKPAN